jgi:hypothetical protein
MVSPSRFRSACSCNDLEPITPSREIPAPLLGAGDRTRTGDPHLGKVMPHSSVTCGKRLLPLATRGFPYVAVATVPRLSQFDLWEIRGKRNSRQHPRSSASEHTESGWDREIGAAATDRRCGDIGPSPILPVRMDGQREEARCIFLPRIPRCDREERRSEDLAEADGNRTRPPGIARRTGFEDREGHQPPFASIPKVSGLGRYCPCAPKFRPPLAPEWIRAGPNGGNTYELDRMVKRPIKEEDLLFNRLADGSHRHEKEGFLPPT